MKCNLLCHLGVVVCLAALAAPAAAEHLPASRVEDYRTAFRGAILEPVGEARLQASRQALLNAVTQLEHQLDGGGPQAVEGWKSYLKWSDLSEQVARHDPDVTVLKDVLLTYRRNVNGLELPAFTNVRTKLMDFIAHIQLARDEPYAQQNCLDRLAVLLARYENEPTGDDAHAIGRILGCLEHSGKSGQAVAAAVRSRFDRPNAYGRISICLVNEVLSREITDRTMIAENKNGTITRGVAHTKGTIAANLIANGQQGTFDVLLKGRTSAPSTVTTRGSVTVRGSFVTNLEAHKQLIFDENGLSDRPAAAHCDTSIQIHDIEAARRFVERLAWRKARRMQPESEQDVSRTAEQRLRGQLDKETQNAVSEANKVYRNSFRNPSTRYGAFPEMFQLSTLPGSLDLTAKFAGSNRIGASVDPPPFDPDQHMSFIMHQSLFDNYCEGIARGKTLTDQQWLNLMNVLTGSEPRALWVHDRAARWAFTFADEWPLTVAIADGKFTITIRSKRVTIDGRAYDRPAEVAATFSGFISEDGPALQRHGELVTRYADDSRQDDEDRQLLKFLHRKFSAVLPEALHFDGLVPPAGGSLGELRRLKCRQFDFDDGWMSIGYQVTGERKIN